MDFTRKIKNLTPQNVVMASFDIQSLFTNIPLGETIEIIVSELFGTSSKFLQFTKKQFKDLLNLAVKDSPFIFNSNTYTQIDGVAMGSCLGPTFANAFLCFNEKN